MLQSLGFGRKRDERGLGGVGGLQKARESKPQDKPRARKKLWTWCKVDMLSRGGFLSRQEKRKDS